MKFLKTKARFFYETRIPSAFNEKKLLNRPAASCLLFSNLFAILSAQFLISGREKQ
ncbi:MAG: hypothetical protein QM763_15510 [Agriterribacter sp.]